MKSRTVIYSVSILMLLVLPFVRYFLSTPGQNACVIDYVDNLEESDYSGYMYNINGLRHIEPKNSPMNHSLEQYRVGRAHGCLMASDNLFTDLSNTVYCSVAYMIRKAPVDPALKQPLGILKD